MNNNKNLDALDIMTVMLAFLSLYIYEQNKNQDIKLNAIIYDIENKLIYQDKILGRENKNNNGN